MQFGVLSSDVEQCFCKKCWQEGYNSENVASSEVMIILTLGSL